MRDRTGLDPKLMAELFGTRENKEAEPIKEKANNIFSLEAEPAPVNSPAQVITEPQPQPESIYSDMKIYRARYQGEECTIRDFCRVITNSYGAGDMDTIVDRNSPSWCQVWFTVKEVTETVKGRGFAITETRAQEYLNRLLRDKRRLIEAREDMFRGREYRGVRIWIYIEVI